MHVGPEQESERRREGGGVRSATLGKPDENRMRIGYSAMEERPSACYSSSCFQHWASSVRAQACSWSSREGGEQATPGADPVVGTNHACTPAQVRPAEYRHAMEATPAPMSSRPRRTHSTTFPPCRFVFASELTCVLPHTLRAGSCGRRRATSAVSDRTRQSARPSRRTRTLGSQPLPPDGPLPRIQSTANSHSTAASSPKSQSHIFSSSAPCPPRLATHSDRLAPSSSSMAKEIPGRGPEALGMGTCSPCTCARPACEPGSFGIISRHAGAACRYIAAPSLSVYIETEKGGKTGSRGQIVSTIS